MKYEIGTKLIHRTRVGETAIITERFIEDGIHYYTLDFYYYSQLISKPYNHHWSEGSITANYDVVITKYSVGDIVKHPAGGLGRITYCDEMNCQVQYISTDDQGVRLTWKISDFENYGWKKVEFIPTGTLTRILEEFNQLIIDILALGTEKHLDNNFIYHKTSRPVDRLNKQSLASHANQHFIEYLMGIPHDYFKTKKHQLAAVAVNALIEYWYCEPE